MGEKAIDYPLSFLEEKDYYIFHDLRLKTKEHFFQIDTLLFTRKLAIIIEVKNISGTICFDLEFKQLIQTKEGKEKGYSYPLTQIVRQESQLKEWMSNNRLKDMKIISLVVISNPQTIIRTSSESRTIRHKVIHKEELSTKIIQLEQTLNAECREEKEMKKIFRCLLKQHTERDFSILDRYQIKENELLKGVICPNCYHLPLDRLKGTWYCPRCNKKDKHAHIQALKDYVLLIKPTITNAELRKFLKITSAATANRLLKSMNLSYIGSNKNREYDLTSYKEGGHN